LGARQPTIIAVGGDAFKVMERKVGKEYQVWRIAHCSNYISQEDYRKEVGTI
jgi:hypothetical protein